MKNVLFLHGAIGSAKQFDSLKPYLASDMQMHCLDFPGHASRNTDLNSFSIQNFADDVLAYINKNFEAPVSIVGYSLGGYVALYLAAQYPEKIEKVFTLGTIFFWSPGIAEQQTKFLNPEKIIQKVPAFAKQLEQIHGTMWQNVLMQTVQMLLINGANPLLSKQVLTTIEKPVCVCLGDKDTTAGLDASLEAYRAIPNANFAVLPNTEHPIEKIDYVQLAALIKVFL